MQLAIIATNLASRLHNSQYLHIVHKLTSDHRKLVSFYLDVLFKYFIQISKYTFFTFGKSGMIIDTKYTYIYLGFNFILIR